MISSNTSAIKENNNETDVDEIINKLLLAKG